MQKNGKAVSFVFDISYSMQAQDSIQNMSRLNAASLYAKALLKKMQGCSVSVILSKGESIIAVPQTEDFESVISLTENLSPTLIAKQGSSIASGIEKAMLTFPKQSAQKAHIWVFTDGEETDSLLSVALQKAVQSGISVSIIGFGSEEGTNTLAGDKSTSVFTALQSKKIEEAIEAVNKKNLKKNSSLFNSQIAFVKAEEQGSANALLKSLEVQSSLLKNKTPSPYAEENFLMYEVVQKDRIGLFLTLAIFCIASSVFFGDLNIKKQNVKKASLSLILFTTVLLTGCSNNFEVSKKILKGKLEYGRKNFSFAIADFLETQERAKENKNEEAEQYALFALASTYIPMNENEAANMRLSQIQNEKSEDLQFAVFYNQGIIAHRRGEYKTAAEYFKKALLVNSTNEDAKINLELSLKEMSAHTHEAVEEKQNTSEQSTMEEAIFSVLRESEKNIWKNHQQEDTESSALDY